VRTGFPQNYVLTNDFVRQETAVIALNYTMGKVEVTAVILSRPLSGGERQGVAFARALANRPRLLLPMSRPAHLIQRAAGARLPSRGTPRSADVPEIACMMSDYDLLSVPVVDDGSRMIGVVSLDDIVERILPDDWRRRRGTARE
jgi:hypothetical protein